MVGCGLGICAFGHGLNERTVCGGSTQRRNDLAQSRVAHEPPSLVIKQCRRTAQPFTLKKTHMPSPASSTASTITVIISMVTICRFRPSSASS